MDSKIFHELKNFLKKNISKNTRKKVFIKWK
jgi:hypothetical protein